MPLPATLNAGYISIYGIGTNSVNGITPPTDNFLFGLVDQSWSLSPTIAQVGQTVMFDKSIVLGTFVYAGQGYTIIPEDKIILVESPPL